MKDQFAEWAYGENSVIAQFGAVVCRTSDSGDGVKRTMIGGIVVSDFGAENWQRWRGTMILIPRMIDKERVATGSQLQSMMLNYLGYECEEVKKVPKDSHWVPEWRAPK